MGTSLHIPEHHQIPYYDQVVSSLVLQTFETYHTTAFVNVLFQKQLADLSTGRISRQKNPFCPLAISDNDNWITCCFINPYTVLALPPLLDSGPKIPYQDYIVKPLFDDTQTDIKIAEAACIEENSLYLLFLEQPYYKNGWAGVCAINSQQELQGSIIKTVNHPEYYLDKQKNQMTYAQSIKMYDGSLEKLGATFKLPYSEDIVGTLIFKIIDNKPYVIGVQIIKSETKFFTEANLKDMKKASMQFLKSKFNEEKIVEVLNKGVFGHNQYA